jgi:hypothetical protein
MYRLHVGSNRHAWPKSGLSVIWYNRISKIKRPVTARAGQREIAEIVPLTLTMMLLEPDACPSATDKPFVPS